MQLKDAIYRNRMFLLLERQHEAFGAVMAAFLYAFILLLQYIFNTKICATENLQELYGLPQLGMIPVETGRKKALGGILIG